LISYFVKKTSAFVDSLTSNDSRRNNDLPGGNKNYWSKVLLLAKSMDLFWISIGKHHPRQTVE